ncbi:Carbon monoxide dehydrogenase medium chain [Sesbania bispinosa]|nr:Carbon monoxide dehydrogenase medium chain [Sesbania bispinosa]
MGRVGNGHLEFPFYSTLARARKVSLKQGEVLAHVRVPRLGEHISKSQHF